MDTGVSIWATAALKHLLALKDKPLHDHTAGNFNYKLTLLGDSLFIVIAFGNKQHMALRAAYSPDGFTDYKINTGKQGIMSVELISGIGKYTVEISWPENDEIPLHYTTSLTLSETTCVPFWPRDILIYGNPIPKGDIHVSQIGARSGLIYAAFKKKGSFLYFQNLTALEAYNTDTETSAASIVGGLWPEMGLSLPPTKDKTLQQGKTYVVSDAYISVSGHTPADQFEIAKGFLESLGNLYLLLPRPDVKYHDYLDALPKALHDLQTNKGCWSHRSGYPYLNAYLCDYNTPPEVMVQLAVLLPVRDYMQWSGETCTIAQEILDGLSAFYDEKLGTVMRWLPAEQDKLDASEEQKQALVMDAWYLHHPLLNLARMAMDGLDLAKELLLNSVDYAIKVAHHFNYVWPVFYKMDTLEVVKAETQPGKGGEKDVAGLYAHVMLQVWELTKDKKYFREAEKAAQSMVQHGFDILYQANNTVFAAKAMILLYKETKKELYRDLTYLFLANIFKNVALWQCGYGYGKNFPTYFELFPLSDAPYTAVYEEQEAYAGVHEFLNYADGIELLPSVRVLMSEFVRYAVNRMIYYYPPMLPNDMLVKETKTGEIDPKLWVALEDVHDGWEQSGSVGQEVYGAGLTFGIVPRQYIRIPDQDFIVFIDYPVLNQSIKGKKLTFDVIGDGRLTCAMRIIDIGTKGLPKLQVKVTNKDDQQRIDGAKQKKSEQIFELHGNQSITVSWGN